MLSASIIRQRTMAMARPMYEKQVYTSVFQLKISDTLLIQVKKAEGTDKKFFDVRRRDAKTGYLGKSGIFLLRDEFCTFEEALKNLPKVGYSKNYEFVTGRTLDVESLETYVRFSASREKSQRGAATINISHDEIGLIILSLPAVRKCLE